MSAFLDRYQDIPEHLRVALADVTAGQTVPIPLFPIGEWKSAKYPSLPLTRELADELISNFEARVLGTDPVLDSSGSHDTSAPAAGWFTRLHVEPTTDGGEMLFGDAKLTDVGATMLNAGLYKYDSVELGPVVDNVTGKKTDNVFRSATLTNTPVLRMLPPVLDAAGSIAASEAITVALAEITAAVIPEFIRAKMRAKWLKANPDKTEDDVPDEMKKDSGTTAASDSASSEPDSRGAKGEEGHQLTLADGSAETEGREQMKTVALKLNLSEDADEGTILAEVTRLEESRDAEKKRADDAEATLAEAAKATRTAAVEATLSALIDGGHLLPGQKDEMLALSEDSPAGFDRAAEILKTAKAITLGETGSASAGDQTSYADASVELAEKAKARKAADGITFAAAQRLVLTENEDLAARYDEFRAGKE